MFNAPLAWLVSINVTDTFCRKANRITHLHSLRSLLFFFFALASAILGNTRAYAYLAVLDMFEGNDEQLKLCFDSLSGEDRMDMASQCVRYSGHDSAVERQTELFVRSTLAAYPTTRNEDLAIIEKRNVSGRKEMAVRFRADVKRLLMEFLGEAVEEDKVGIAAPVATPDDDNVRGRVNEGDLTESVALFNDFIESLNFPVNYLTAYVAGDGMGVGTKANRDIKKGDVYISVPDVATMSSKTASSKNQKTSEIIQMGKDRNDDFHTLAFFLLHERFNEQQNSYWWPYLNLLPTLNDYKANNPLFFSEEKLSFLSGSDIKNQITENANRYIRQFNAISSDATVTGALGSAWTRDNYLWAATILDSRSIWWDGIRHLVPLLDLINCQELTDVNAIHKTELDAANDNALTWSPDNFKSGGQVFENYGQVSCEANRSEGAHEERSDDFFFLRYDN